MVSSTVFSVLFLLIVWPVVTLSIPVRHSPNRKSISGLNRERIYNHLQFPMNELTGNRTVCPFVETNKTTGGIPEIVFEYSCVSQVNSGAVHNSVGRCMKNHECIQGTTTILIQMPNKMEPIPRIFNSGCFCAQQKGSTPEYVTLPTITN